MRLFIHMEQLFIMFSAQLWAMSAWLDVPFEQILYILFNKRLHATNDVVVINAFNDDIILKL